MTHSFFDEPPRRDRRSNRAVTLIELLCVFAIIAILVSLFAPVAMKALKKARMLSGEVEEPAFIEEIRRKYTPYRLANRTHATLDRSEFAEACGLSQKARAWLRSSQVTYHPFSGSSPANFLVIEHRVQLIGAQKRTNWHTVAGLLLPEPQ